MATKSLIRTAALAATLLAAAACIYPYEVDIQQGSELPLVVEGDIHIGDTTTLVLSHVVPLHTNYDKAYLPVNAQGYIESEDGTRITGRVLVSGELTFDTSGLSGDRRCRVHFETLDQQGAVTNVFESDWLDPCPAPTIDALTYNKNDEFGELWIGLSMHCNGSHHFHWSFSETWEYHSDINAMIWYDPEARMVERYDYGSPNLYYCWATRSSSQINIFSTANQTEDRFEELAFHTIPLNDDRLMSVYRITVRLEAMSENAYNYWYNMQQNSEGQGSIFAPTPSEMASNVHCVSDPSVQVLGYLNAAAQTEGVMYYDDALNHYHISRRPFERYDRKVSAQRPDSLEYWYKNGYLPYEEVYEDEMSDFPTHYMWAQQICIDCRKQGGTKNKPEGWPSTHK